MSELSPPPYESNVATTERTITAAQHPAPLQLTVPDIAGLRAQILDNAPTLFLLVHGNSHPLPPSFRINTARDLPDRLNGGSGKFRACVISLQTVARGQTALHVFVQSPQAESTEGALMALLEKMESMIGRKWREGVQKGVILKSTYYIKSIDE